MKKTDIRLIKKSIDKKWIPVALGEKTEKGTEDCPLCDKYFEHDDRPYCTGCPIRDYTGKSSCTGTPYAEFARWQHNTVGYDGKINLNDPNHAEGVRTAMRMVKFLKSLLPEHHK